MNWADYTIIAVLVLSVLIGLWRGLVSEVLALGVWVAAVWLAWAFGDDVAHLFDNVVDLPSARLLLGYGCCFLVVLLAGVLLRFVLHKLVEGTGLDGSDRMLGMLFGLARGVVLVTLLVMLLGFTPFPGDPWWQESRVLPAFQNAAVWLGRQLPEDVDSHMNFDAAAIPQVVASELLPHTLPAASGSTPRAADPGIPVHPESGSN